MTMMRYQTALPSPFLSQLVDQYWSVETDLQIRTIHTELVVPDGTSQLIFHYGNPFLRQEKTRFTPQPELLLCGPETTAASVSAPAGSGMIGVVFKPAGLAPFFRLPIGLLTSQQLALHELIGREADELLDRLSAAQAFHSRIRVIESFLGHRLHIPCRFSWGISWEGAKRIAARPSSECLSSLAGDMGISRRSLERLFQNHIGLSPKRYLRICRFQKALAVLNSEAAPNLSQLALDCGYYDQAHLCNDFKKFCGLSPGAFICQRHKAN